MIPNPGSNAAIAQGCTCPVLDNKHGTGVLLNGEHLFWMNEGCPIHATPLASVNPNHTDTLDTPRPQSDYL